MSAKRNNKSTARVPTFVAAATIGRELAIAPATFHKWLDDGILPPPSPGFPPSAPRWKWSRVVAWMEGDRSDVPAKQVDLFAEGSPQLQGHRRRGPRKGTGGRPKHAGLPAAVRDDIARTGAPPPNQPEELIHVDGPTR